jgi:FtsH-binding integral membrane protein
VVPSDRLISGKNPAEPMAAAGPTAHDEAARRTVAAAVNRGYNILAVTLLGVLALVFVGLVGGEADPMDKIDNTVLVVLGVAAVIWYFASGQREKRTVTPLILAGLALIGQLVGLGLEIGDASAIGDDMGGTLAYVGVVVILSALYSVNRRYAG